MKKINRRSLECIALIVTAAPLALACSPATLSGGDGSGATGSGPRTDAGGGTISGEGGVIGSAADGASEAEADAAPLPVMVTYLSGVTVSTLAGSDVPGTQDGVGAAAQFDNPTGMALDANGNLLTSDYDDGHVRLVTPAGVVTTIAEATNFVNPFATAVASDGRYYVETDANSAGVKDATTGTIWLVTPLSGGGITTPTLVAQGFDRPRSLAPMAGGNLFVADRTLDVIETLAVASGQATVIAGTSGASGYLDATGASARFNYPSGAAPMPDGSFLVTDSANNVIRRVTAGGVVTTFAGNGSPTLVDGPCAAASFNAPRGVAVDSAGNAYVSDIGNHAIRMVSATNCAVQTLAGNLTMGYADGAGNTTEFYGQEGIGVTPDGRTIYVADGNGGDGSPHHRIRGIAMPSSL
jgi:sugar lactone lactonase YvrE